MQDATKLTALPQHAVIVTEGFLGSPLHANLRSTQVSSVIAPVDHMYQAFFANLLGLLNPGSRLVISMPVWQTSHGFEHLPVIDRLEQIGYTFEQCNGQKTLIYKRDNQFVGREIAILVVK